MESFCPYSQCAHVNILTVFHLRMDAQKVQIFLKPSIKEFLSLQPKFLPKSFDKFSPEGGCSEGFDAFRFFLN